MASLNKVQIIGRMGADPEVRYGASGDAMGRIRLAVTDAWKDKKTGEAKEHTEWFTCKAFGKTAEILAEYTRKGSLLYVEGKLKTEEWEKDGQKRKEVVLMIQNVEFLSRRERDDDGQAEKQGGARDSGNRSRTDAREQRAAANPDRKGAPPKTGPEANPFEDDDIPF